jgi:ABC-type transport system substrate-binding protein
VPPTGGSHLRIYRWTRPSLSFGRNQPARGRYDPHALRPWGWRWSAAPPGGGRCSTTGNSPTPWWCPSRPGSAPPGMPAFCQEVLPAVDAWVAGLEQPTGSGTGERRWWGDRGDPRRHERPGLADYTANQHQLFVNLMSLVRLDEALEPQPYLAESWELSRTETELTFHLRDDVYWHDGTPTTARDVEFTYLRATDPATGLPQRGLLDQLRPGPEGVEVVDDHTVRFRLQPHAEFLDPWRAHLHHARAPPGGCPPAELRQHPFGTRCPVGNGPFVFAEHRQDESWTFVPEPRLPRGLGGPPYLERYVYRVIPEPTTLLTELLTENLDVYIAPLPDQAPRSRPPPPRRVPGFPFRSYVFVGGTPGAPSWPTPGCAGP